MEEKNTFKVSSALKDLIGRELITNELIAVFELVKNSFDAYASKVTIEFKANTENVVERIVISDDGNGMSKNDIISKWLFVAFSDKKEANIELDYRTSLKNRRVMAGSKGVGRFSCDRLGSYLMLVSRIRENNSALTGLKVNWVDFEKDIRTEFKDISVELFSPNKISYKTLKNGTILEISGLRDLWTREKILSLKKSISKLVNPRQASNERKFEIEIIASHELKTDSSKSDFNEIVNGIIVNSIFEKLEIQTCSLQVNIAPDGLEIETVLKDKGKQIYTLKEKNQFKGLKNISFYLFYLDTNAKIQFKKNMGVSSKNYGSVFVYKNGFRIHPYGEPGEDVFQIDARKQQGYNRYLGTREIFARIEINGYQTGLMETTSRDGGLLKTETYYQLVDFFIENVLKRLENFVVNVIKWGSVPDETITNNSHSQKSSIELLKLLTGFINSKNILDLFYDEKALAATIDVRGDSTDRVIKDLRMAMVQSGNPNLLKKIKSIEKLFSETKADLEKSAEIAQEERAKRKALEKSNLALTKQLNFLENEVTDDTKQLESLIHHVKIAASFIKQDIKILINEIRKLNVSNEIYKIIQRINYENEKIILLPKYLKKASFDLTVAKISIDIISFVEEYLEKVFKPSLTSLRRNNISFTCVNNNLEFKGRYSPIDIIMVLDNLIDNAIKHNASEIKLTWLPERNGVQLKFEDNGDGVKQEIAKYIFDFGFTTSEYGTGIGLAHVRVLLLKMNGSIVLNEKNEERTEFVIILRRS